VCWRRVYLDFNRPLRGIGRNQDICSRDRREDRIARFVRYPRLSPQRKITYNAPGPSGLANMYGNAGDPNDRANTVATKPALHH
jgi:hypothetical protein